SVAAAAQLTYTINVTHVGSLFLPSSNAQLTDVIPANTTFVRLDGATGSWSCTAPTVGGQGTVHCTNSSMDASKTFTLVVHVNSNPTPSDAVTNTATVSQTESDVTPADNTSTLVVPITPASADLIATKTLTPYPVIRESALLTSTIVVSNQGPSDVTRTIITDTPSTNVEFVSVSPTGAWQCGYTGGFVPSLEVVTCTIGAFPADTTDTITVVWEVNPHTAGLLPACDRAQIKSVSTTDPNLVNNL